MLSRYQETTFLQSVTFDYIKYVMIIISRNTRNVYKNHINKCQVHYGSGPKGN